MFGLGNLLTVPPGLLARCPLPVIKFNVMFFPDLFQRP